MRALSLVGVGLLVVFVDLRLQGFDVVLDPVGWAMVAAGLGRLRERHPSLGTARTVAFVALGLSVLQVAVGLADPVGSAWIGLLEVVADLGVVVTMCAGLSALLADVDPERARSISMVRTASIVLAVVLLPVGVWAAATQGATGVMTSVDAGPWSVPIVALVLAGLAVRLWLIVLLFRVAPVIDGDARPLADPDGPEPLVP